MLTTIPIEDEIARRGIALRRCGVERVGPCPQCGGRDRFSINIRKQLWNCRGCGRGGDVIDLVRHLDGVGFNEARRILGNDSERPIIRPQRPVISREVTDKNMAKALNIWRETVEGDPLVDAYFASRKLETPSSSDVRFHAACRFGNGRYPCIVCLFRNIHTNAPQAIHRTALNADGTKLGRMTLGPCKGAAIKLTPDEDVEQGLTIGEGLETCLSGMRLGFTPAWCVGSAGGIKNFPVLADIDALSILVDADEADPKTGRRAGQDAALECSAQWTAAGREVFRVVPRLIGSDMADVWKQEHRHEG
jgi:hypothetical protein